jgi:hypothetical protein
MAHQPRNGDAIFVSPLVPLACDEHRRPLPATGKLVAWSEHYQRAYDAGDIEASRSVDGEMLPLSADEAPAPPAGQPAPAEEVVS